MNDTSDWYGPDTATFGDRLSAAREKSGMSQEALARRLGVKLKTLQGWEDDMSEPRANKLNTVAGLLNVSIVWLITGEGEGIPAPDEAPAPPDIQAILLEIRTVQTQMKSSAEKLARLEKRLRAQLAVSAPGA